MNPNPFSCYYCSATALCVFTCKVYFKKSGNTATKQQKIPKKFEKVTGQGSPINQQNYVDCLPPTFAIKTKKWFLGVSFISY